QKVVRVSGTMLNHFGDPVEGLFDFPVDVTEHGPGGDTSGGTITGTYYPHDGPNGLDGEISIEYVTLDDTTSVTLDVRSPELGYPQVTIDNLVPGLNEYEWIHEI